MRASIAAALTLAFLCAPLAAHASDPVGPRCRRASTGVYECSETRVDAARPRAYVLLGRSRHRHEARALQREDLTREVARAVRRDPF